MDQVLTPVEAMASVRDGSLSHQSAAREHGIELLTDDGSCHLTVPRDHSRVQVSGWVVHRADLGKDALAGRTTPPRTVLDLARSAPLDVAVAAADSVLRQRLARLDEVRSRLTGTKGRGAAAPRLVASMIDPRSGSVLESAFRVLVAQAGWAPPRTQYVVRDGRAFVARVDFCWLVQRLIVETDGFAFHSDRAAYRNDRQRMNQLESLGWRVLRFTWEDVMHRPEYVVALVAGCLKADLVA